MSGCNDIADCPAIKKVSDELAIVHANYATSQAIAVNTQKALDENTKAQSKINLELVQVGSDLKHLCKDFAEERSNNKKGHNILFERQRDDEKRIGTLETAVETKLGVINTNQATKLSTWDLLKIIIGCCVVGSFFLGFLNYIGVFGG